MSSSYHICKSSSRSQNIVKVFIIPMLFGILFSQQDTSKIQIEKNSSIFDTPRNTIFLETIIFFNSINYGRIIPLFDDLGISVDAGIGWEPLSPSFYYTIKPTLILGGPKHLFEAGGELYVFYYEDLIGTGYFGYRFQNPKGFLFKGGILIIPVFEAVLPILTFGYSF